MYAVRSGHVSAMTKDFVVVVRCELTAVLVAAKTPSSEPLLAALFQSFAVCRVILLHTRGLMIAEPEVNLSGRSIVTTARSKGETDVC